MKIKATLIAAATLAVGVISSHAQVYSQNIVGYVNVPVNNGFNLVSTPLDYDGTGTNSTVVNVFSNSLPVGTKLYLNSGASYTTITWTTNRSGTATNWSSNPVIEPGLGYWLAIPAGYYANGTGTVTYVGNVLTGNLTNNYVAGPGFNLVSSQIPVAGSLQANLNYIPALGDKVYINTGASYTTYTYTTNRSGTATNWSPSQPPIGLAQGFWLNSAAGTKWTNSFNP